MKLIVKGQEKVPIEYEGWIAIGNEEPTMDGDMICMPHPGASHHELYWPPKHGIKVQKANVGKTGKELGASLGTGWWVYRPGKGPWYKLPHDYTCKKGDVICWGDDTDPEWIVQYYQDPDHLGDPDDGYIIYGYSGKSVDFVVNDSLSLGHKNVSVWRKWTNNYESTNNNAGKLPGNPYHGKPLTLP